MSDVPSLAEELERKTVTELQRVMHAVTTRRVGLPQASASLQTLWDTCAGLVSPETMHLISESGNAVRAALEAKDRPEEIVLFMGAGNVVLLRRYLDRVVVSMGPAQRDAVHASQSFSSPLDDPNPAVFAAEKCKRLVAHFGTTMSRVV